MKQLKNIYELIKKEIKKRCSEQKIYARGTGGGPYISPLSFRHEEEQTLAENIALTVHGLQSEFDSDGVGGKTEQC